MNTIPIEELRRILRLDNESGHLWWKISPRRNTPAGTRAGCLGVGGYRTVGWKGKHIPEHRIVFALFHGFWPKGFIDHINMDRADNRPSNLREASNAQNMRNASIQKSNTSGIKGVSWNGRLAKWHAYIDVDGKRKHLGFHQDQELASLVVSEARDRYHGEYARAT